MSHFEKIAIGDIGTVNVVDVVKHEDETSLRVVTGHKEAFRVHLDIENIGATTGFMIIDLSDTTNWPHTLTGHIVLEHLSININPTTAFRGDIEIGFLTDVDGTDGDFHRIYTYHLDQQGAEIVDQLPFFGGMDLEEAEWFGPTSANDATWQDDVNIQGPDARSVYPSGDGDFVVKITQTAGNVDVAILVTYETRA